jgi:hypothetical protein
MNRRRIAIAIRLRQELAKRFSQRTPPTWSGPTSLMRELSAAHGEFSELRAAGLLQALRQSVSQRAPLVPIAIDNAPADAARIMEQASALLNGEWRVFEHPMSPDFNAMPWLRHPLSGVDTPLEHFSRIHYTGDHLGGDVKYIWELNRHAELIRLAQAYYLTRNEQFASTAIQLLDSWMHANPPEQGINWVSVVDVSFRSIAWCWLWKLTSGSSAWTTDIFARFLWTLSKSARFVERYDSIHHSPNTHLTGEALGLLYVGTTFPELARAAHWRKRGIEILRSEVPHQFLADGFHYERATGYHRYNLEFYLHALAVARATGESWGEEFVLPLRRALDVTLLLRKPDGDWPVFGDEDGGATVRLWASAARNQNPLLALGAGLLNDSRWLEGISAEDLSLSWWLSVVVPPESVPSVPRSFALGAAGYFGATDYSETGSWYCVVDAGPHGGDRTGHAHTDLGHVEVALGAASIVVDPGCAVYASDDVRRDWYRSLKSHASLTSDSDSLWSCTLRYAPSPSLEHERQVLLVRGYGVFIADFVDGSGVHTLAQHWPLGTKVDDRAVNQQSKELTMESVVFAWTATAEVTAALREAKRSPSYGSEEVVSALDLHLSDIALPARLITYLRHSDTGAATLTNEGALAKVRLPDSRELVIASGKPPVLVVPKMQLG